VAAKKSIAKILIMTFQVNLVLNHSEIWRRQHKFTWIVIIKIFSSSIPPKPFLGLLFGFHMFFFVTAFYEATHFLQLAVTVYTHLTKLEKISPALLYLPIDGVTTFFRIVEM